MSLLTFGKAQPKKSSRQTSSRSSSTPARTTTNTTQKSSDKPASAEGGRSSKRRERAEVTSGRLYVGNLDYNTQEADLEELFRGVGTVVSAEVVTNSRTQQSKGFAFVEMLSISEAKRAVEQLDDKDFMGRKLIISGARSEGPRDGSEETDGANEPAEAVAASAEETTA